VTPASGPSGRTGRPSRTSRAEILAAARALIERDGWEKLTIRRLAADLGVGATTLYHHVRDKQDLQLLLLDSYLEQSPRPELPPEPRERIITASTAMHDSLAAWPWVVEVISAEGFIAMLSADSMWSVEAILAAAVDLGCTPVQAVHVFRTIWHYTVGEILVRARSARRAGDQPPDFSAGVDATKLPTLAGLFDRWQDLAGRDSYADGLTALVDGLLINVG
jgi:AcrR family transcriptional regulator